MHLSGVQHHLTANLGGYFGFESERPSESEPDGSLPFVVEHSGHIDGGVRRLNEIGTLGEIFVHPLPFENLAQGLLEAYSRLLFNLGNHTFHGRGIPYEHAGLSGKCRHTVVPQPTPTLQSGKQRQGGDYAPDYFFHRSMIS